MARSPLAETPPGTPAAAGKRLGFGLSALGLIVILASVLWVSSAGYGTRPRRQFSERRSYDTVKRDVHAVFPYAFPLGLAGLGLMIAGASLRRRFGAPAARPAGGDDGGGDFRASGNTRARSGP